MDPADFARLHTRCPGVAASAAELFVQDCFVGADPKYRVPTRVITEYAWHSLFARNLFIVDPADGAVASDNQRFTVIDSPSFKADPARYGTRSAGHHRAQFRPSPGHHRRNELCRRDQEIDVHRPQRSAPHGGRALDALLGEHREGRAILRSSLVCRAPARRRCRAIRSGRSSATTSMGGAKAACSTSRADATRRRSSCQRKPSRRSTPRRDASARSWRTCASIRSHACSIWTTIG